MSDRILKATHSGILEIGDSRIPCYVLEDGERMISTRGVMKALGRTWRGRKYSGTHLPVFLEANNLKPFISEDLTMVLTENRFKTDKGTISEGFKAKMLPMVCEVYLKARDSGILKPQQERIALKADILMRGLAHVGIIALIDEATGYQEIRDRKALQAILDKYLRKELAAWAKRFPDEFYMQIFKLKGWQWKGMKVNRPGVVGRYTQDIVYERLAPGILEELEKRNPKDEKGNRPSKHHQWLTEDIGHPALAQHLHATTGLMRASTTWDQFYRMLQRAFPKKMETLPLLMDE